MLVAFEALIIQAMGIGEQGIFHPQLDSLGVHRIDEGLRAVFRIGRIICKLGTYRFRNRLRSVVAGRDHKRLERIFQSHGIALLQVGTRFTDICCSLAHGDRIVQGRIFQGNERSHHLRDARDGSGIGIIALEVHSSILPDDVHALGGDIGALGIIEPTVGNGLFRHLVVLPDVGECRCGHSDAERQRYRCAGDCGKPCC